jgi:hypothetical protein
LKKYGATIVAAWMASHEILTSESICEFNGGVVGDLKLFRQFTDGDMIPIRESLDREQGLVLPGSETGRYRSFFAEA